MGVYLSTPCTDIDSEAGEGLGLRYCAGEIQVYDLNESLWRSNLQCRDGERQWKMHIFHL